jgi:hypothetical protein
MRVRRLRGTGIFHAAAGAALHLADAFNRLLLHPGKVTAAYRILRHRTTSALVFPCAIVVTSSR